MNPILSPVLLAVALLAACGSKKPTDTGPPTPPPGSKYAVSIATATIGCDRDHAFLQFLNHGITVESATAECTLKEYILNEEMKRPPNLTIQDPDPLVIAPRTNWRVNIGIRPNRPFQAYGFEAVLDCQAAGGPVVTDKKECKINFI